MKKSERKILILKYAKLLIEAAEFNKASEMDKSEGKALQAKIIAQSLDMNPSEILDEAMRYLKKLL